MSWTDLLLAGGLIIGSIYLLYRSVWKRKGFCPGCDSRACSIKADNKKLLG